MRPGEITYHLLTMKHTTKYIPLGLNGPIGPFKPRPCGQLGAGKLWKMKSVLSSPIVISHSYYHTITKKLIASYFHQFISEEFMYSNTTLEPSNIKQPYGFLHFFNLFNILLSNQFIFRHNIISCLNLNCLVIFLHSCFIMQSCIFCLLCCS